MLAAAESLRAIARRFQCEPRRLRRALARLNLRVGGRDIVPDVGVPQLLGVRDAIGREPDSVVARMGGVIPEAVQGDRRRLGIPAYAQHRRVRLSREEEAWIRGPKRGRRAKVHVEENLQVVRRPTRTDENAHRPSGWGVGHADPRPRPSGEFQSRPPRLDREFFRAPAPDDLEKLLQPVRQRDGRQRIVRGEPIRGAGDSLAPAPPEVPMSRREMYSSPPVPPEPRRTPVRSLPAVVVKPSEPAPAASAGVSVASTPPRLPRVSRRVVEAPIPATPVRADEWLVYVPGNDTPLRVYAPDIVQAISAASRIVPPDLLRLASVWRAEEA